jgi:2-methylisocitrate lyase-like PEP mutase family enzyme
MDGWRAGLGPRRAIGDLSLGSELRHDGRPVGTDPPRKKSVVSAYDDRVVAFRRLHSSSCFVMPNPWDVGSARVLEQLGFQALATTSAGFAWTLGRMDTKVTRDEALEHVGGIVGAVSVPVNADFEDGYAVDPQDVQENVRLAVSTGIAGLSIEDSTRDQEHPLYELDLAVERIRAARQAIDDSGTGVMLTGRSEGFVVGRPDIDETIRRLRAYSEAGADCLYAPRIDRVDQIAAIVAAVAPKPVNLLINSPFVTVAQAAELGVRRISVGGTLARAAWKGWMDAASEIVGQGTFANFDELPNVEALMHRGIDHGQRRDAAR